MEKTNPVCDRCGSKLLPNGCDGCLAAIAWECARERYTKVRRREAWALGKEFRNKYAHKALMRKKSGRKKWGR